MDGTFCEVLILQLFTIVARDSVEVLTSIPQIAGT